MGLGYRNVVGLPGGMDGALFQSFADMNHNNMVSQTCNMASGHIKSQGSESWQDLRRTILSVPLARSVSIVTVDYLSV